MKLGDVIDGRFELVRLAGKGGAGIVYQGLDREAGAHVALKVLRSADDDRQRFGREVETLAAVRHPGVVAYRAHGTFADEPYLVMEWLEGEDLGARLKAAPLGIADALVVTRQVAGALAAAHARGIVHRDIKPSNVFLVDNRLDRVKLLDFGLARPSGIASLTSTGTLLGTPSYMAPEQARGERDLGPRVDVYGLGALLYHCATGRAPFDGDSVESVLVRILTEPVPRLRELVPDASVAVDELVARMLSKDPGRRPADGRAAHAALLAVDAHTERPARASDEVAAVATLTLTPAPRPDATPEVETVASSIAVLSFTDLSPERDQGYFCDGLTEELINALSHIEGLRVAARISSARFQSAAMDARELGAKLGVDTILEGAVRLAGHRLRVTVQLIDVATGYPRWSDRFDGTLDDIFAIQDDIATCVAKTLRGIVSDAEQHALRRPGTNVVAYSYYLRGRQLIESLSAPSYQLAVQMFERAIELDPSYALAHARLAQLHCRYFEWADGDDAIRDAADRASRQALALAPDLAEAHVARAEVEKVFCRYDASIREFDEAIRLSPNSFDAHHRYARMCFGSGKIEQAVTLFRRATQLCHEDYQSPILLAQALRRLGRDAESNPPRREGMHRLARHLQLWPADGRALSLGASEAVHDGNVDRAVAWAHQAASAAPDDPGVWYNVACAYACLGLKDEAMSWLGKTFGRRIGACEWAENDPDLDGLRDEPRFRELFARLRAR